MLNRKIDEFLVLWGQKKRKKCLVVEGNRQVGKTTSIHDYINKNYNERNIIYIDFSVYPSLGHTINRGYDTDRIYQEISIRFPNKELKAKESIIFFDNIQRFPMVLEYARAFVEDGLYDVIMSGSSMGVIYKTMKRLPVGYLEYFHMDSLDFEEFLWANGYDETQVEYFVKLMQSGDLEFSALHEVLLDLFREYMAIGGMPEVVSEYLEQHNFRKAYDLQKDIIAKYYSEFEEYAKPTMQRKLVESFESLPNQLSKQNKKFQFKLIHEKARATTYKTTVEWLLDSGIVFLSNNLNKPIRPFNDYVKSSSYKLYLHDPGLLCCMFGETTQLEILKGNIHTVNGAVLESTVATMLHQQGLKLHYFESNSTLNVDFILTINGKVVPLVVNDADKPKSKILQSLSQKFGIEEGVRLSMAQSDLGEDKLPIYMTMFLNRLYELG